jgi:hypothetical protein
MDKVAHHIEQAKHHIEAAHAAHNGMEDEEDMPMQSGGLSGLMSGEDEE